MSFKTGIVGAAGYTGGELLRLLVRHPAAKVVFAQSRSQAGKPVSAVHTDLLGETDLFFSAETPLEEVDVVFLCLAHGEAGKWLNVQKLPANLKVIDLSHDHRADASFVYGLPEKNREAIRNALRLANPGCFATALQLALLPLAQAGKLATVYATGITGATGAGQSLSETSHFPWRHANISAYKSLSHQHYGEVIRTLKQTAPDAELHFVPWRGDFPRGIYVSCTTACDLNEQEVYNLYTEFYKDHPFTHVCETMIDLKMVVNTNKCVVHLEMANGQLVVHAAIDNLLKGASGQAVQNMNLMFGINETDGLQLKASAF